jgi:plastocyanin
VARARSLLVITALVAGTLGMAVPLAAAAATTHDVSVTDFAFTPPTVSAVVGDSVRWTFAQGSHTVTSDAAPPLFDFASPGVFTQAFTAAGRFPYHCTIHPSMKGTVLVDDGSAPGPVATFAANPADRQVFLSWTYTKPADFDHFEVRRFGPADPAEGHVIYGGTALKVTATGLTNGTAYTFAIRAVDFAGGMSAAETATATPVLLPTSLTITRSAAKVVYGQSVTIRGTLRYTKAGVVRRLRGEVVRLYGRRAGTTTWQLLATRRSNSDGNVAARLTPSVSRSYKWKHAQTVFYGPSSSPRTSVLVRARLSASVSSVFTGVGDPVYFRGAVRPLRPGRPVHLQRRVGGSWTRVGTAKLSSTGRYTLPYTPRSSGAHDLRVVKPAETGLLGTSSPSIRVTATSRTLRVGSSGADVLALQRQLARLRYDVGALNGRFGYDTLHAVVPFQKVHGLGRDGIVGPIARRRMGNPTPARMREVRSGAHAEVDLTKQVIKFAYNGKVFRILDTSSGNGRPYVVDGRTRYANTPTGRFKITRKIDGIRVSHLGELYRPAYFYGGYAIHGSKSVPPQPASHGCLRVTNPAQDRMFRRWVIGTPVWVYRS